MNVIEIYTAARVLAATGNVLAAQATEDIEREMGGPIESKPEEYTTRTVVRRAEDIKASGVRGVTMVHGADDGLVPYSQSREMQARLLGLGIPTDMVTVGTRGEASEPGTTLTGSLGAPATRRRSRATPTRRAPRTSSATAASSACRPTSGGARRRTAATSWSTGPPAR